MTLCVAVVTLDGLVIGADSMTVLRDAETDSSKHYPNAEKVFELPNLPIVATTYGLGAIGRRSIGNLIDEWSEKRIGFEKSAYSVKEVSEDLGSFIFERHSRFRDEIKRDIEARQSQALANPGGIDSPGVTQYVPTDWTTGLVIGGYQPGSYYPWLYSWEEPERADVPAGLQCVREHQGVGGDDGPEPGVAYWGETAALDRIYRGLDPTLFVQIAEAIRPDGLKAVAESLEHHRWPVLFDGMPLQDAADFAKFMLDVGCNFSRFGEGAAKVGGEPDVVVVTRTKIHWTHRKSIGVALASAQTRAFARRAGESSKAL